MELLRDISLRFFLFYGVIPYIALNIIFPLYKISRSNIAVPSYFKVTSIEMLYQIDINKFKENLPMRS